MIGSGLKKLANENGMKVAKGVGYGSLRGYAATLSEGSGYKQIVLTTKFADPAKLQELQNKVNGRNIQRELWVRNMTFAPNGIGIVFNDNPGTMKKINEFIEWFFPMLDEAGASKWDVCTECGTPVVGGTWKLIDGIAYYLHPSCAEKVLRDLGEEEQARKDADNGNYVTGTIGAFLGAAVGSVLWAVILYLGYVASIVGLAIGFLAEKGYNLLKGKQGKAKVFILILAIIFGVLLGNFASDAITLATMISGGELPGFGYVDIPALIVVLLLGEAEYLSATIGNILMGLVFAALGVFSLLKKAGREVSAAKVIDLDKISTECIVLSAELEIIRCSALFYLEDDSALRPRHFMYNPASFGELSQQRRRFFMVKGTSRQVIVVHAPEEKLFDQAIFILRDGAVGEAGVTDEALLREAKRYLGEPGKRAPKWLHNGPLWGAVGAGLTGVVWLLSQL